MTAAALSATVHEWWDKPDEAGAAATVHAQLARAGRHEVEAAAAAVSRRAG